ncbi:pilin [Patescibacteria group bacterium]|nr:pilin [Patescibacteria group bacterium]
MKKNISKLSFYLTIFIVVIFPFHKVFSAGIVPDCGNIYACNFCDLIILVNNIINFIIYLSVPISAMMFAYAGVMYLSGDPGKISNAHGIFRNVALGLVFILGAWLLVNLITSSLLKADFKDILNKSYDCPKVLLNDVSRSSTSKNQISTQTTSTSKTNSSEAENRLKANSIGITSTGNCSDPAFSNCTSLEGIQTKTLDGIIGLANGCRSNGNDCEVTVTGGTETKHTQAHSDGKKVDLSKNDPVFNNFMETLISNYLGENITEGTKYSNVKYQNATYTIIEEGNHWDVQVLNR